MMISLKKILLEAMDLPPPAIVRQEPAKPSANVMNQQQLKDAYLVVATVWEEAHDEGYKGMQAVMNVIMNRSKNNFSNTRKVILKPKQFSCWNNISHPDEHAAQMAQNFRSGKTTGYHLSSYQDALKIVDRAMKGKLSDITGGATFYFNPKLANPRWAVGMIRTLRLKNHNFYKPK
jgi:N-acetylmuramoyl-L-alanine amidase